VVRVHERDKMIHHHDADDSRDRYDHDHGVMLMGDGVAHVNVVAVDDAIVVDHNMDDEVADTSVMIDEDHADVMTMRLIRKMAMVVE
jgi:hypothetical protein